MRRRRQAEQRSPVTGERDEVLAHTCRVVAAACAEYDVGAQFGDGAAAFPLSLHPHDSLLAWGGFDRAEVGCGTVPSRRSGALVFGNGPVATGLMIGTVAGSLLGARARRQQAAQASIPRWVPAGSGTLFVSVYGFYLQDQSGVFPWSWPSMTSAQMVAPACVELTGDGQAGPVRWRIASMWSELVFGLWASVQNPQHPQLRSGGWLPPGWSDSPAPTSPARDKS